MTAAATIAPAACPICGKPYGKRRRCYSCTPGNKFRPERARIPTSLDRQIEAIRTLSAALDRLDSAEARAVIAWLSARYGGPPL